ncbi:hypothetical protein AVEN_179037-1 [Araneus ventricosus]|uniref:Uncharacterized protein n=1 Tax=Araneus ventricosus TaxID=182803 RepID=A0A4Y2RMY6_ARAVE|nr:hypothetical protein AVEN_179037-1 [Araneus ventricosus]
MNFEQQRSVRVAADFSYQSPPDSGSSSAYLIIRRKISNPARGQRGPPLSFSASFLHFLQPKPLRRAEALPKEKLPITAVIN